MTPSPNKTVYMLYNAATVDVMKFCIHTKSSNTNTFLRGCEAV